MQVTRVRAKRSNPKIRSLMGFETKAMVFMILLSWNRFKIKFELIYKLCYQFYPLNLPTFIIL